MAPPVPRLSLSASCCSTAPVCEIFLAFNIPCGVVRAREYFGDGFRHAWTVTDRTRQHPDRHRDVETVARRRWLEAAAVYGAGAATAWGIAFSVLVVPAQNVTREAVTDSHVRSLMGAHLMDVASSACRRGPGRT